jgi:2-methylcitrate dehydratase
MAKPSDLQAAPAVPDALLGEIADHVHGYRIRDRASIDAARLCLFDTLACALEALDHPECVRLLGPVVPGTVVPDGARLPGTAFVLDPAKATFDLGAMIRWLDYNDACNGMLRMHPSYGLAGVLMLGDHLSRRAVSTGKAPLTMADLLDAAVRVYEIQGALCAANDWRAHGMDQTMLVHGLICKRVLHLGIGAYL